VGGSVVAVVAIGCAVVTCAVVACDPPRATTPEARRAAAVAVAPASASANGSTSANASASPAAASPPSAAGAPGSTAAADATELAMGEAVLLDGAAPTGADQPSGHAIDTMRFSEKQVVVIARAEGTATLPLLDGRGARSDKTFRVVAELCRPKPLHPAIVLDVNASATVSVGRGVVQVEATRREPWIAGTSTGRRAGEITVLGQAAGHSSVIVLAEDRSVLLYDVFVGGTCKDKAYGSIASAVPPGFVGPRGDGACVRTNDGKTSPAPCPDLAKIDALSDDALSPIACDWAASCGIMGHEGCCIGCANPFRMKLARPCAVRALRAKTCAAVKKELMAPSCIR